MKSWLKIFLFVLAFQMEIRVRASGGLLQQPEACLKTQGVCVVQVDRGEGFHFKQKSTELHAMKETVLMRHSEGAWRLVKGTLWVEKAPGVEVETLYGFLSSERGQYWLLDQGDRVLVRNVNADLKVILKDGKKLHIPEGFEFWMAGINSKGQSDYGMIRPIDMKEHLPLWQALYRGTKKQFVKEVLDLRENWGDLAERSSFIYQAEAEREIASLHAREEQAKQSRERRAAEARQIKEMFRRRAFER